MNDILLYGIAITALLVSDVILMLLGALIYRVYRQSQIQANDQNVSTQELRQDLKGLSVSLSVLGERLARLETQMGRLEDRQGQQAMSSNKEADHRSFQVATKMALQGADVEEIVHVCGLTQGEAELVRMLHAKHQADQKTSSQSTKQTRIKDNY
jgi:predicted nuclease with TOPRIM domain